MSSTNGFEFLARHRLGQGGLVEYVALGKSMRPVIPSGSTVTLAPIDTLEIGDVGLAFTAHGPILHRLVQQIEGGWVLSGDLNGATLRVSDTDIVGIAVSCILPNGRPRNLRRPILKKFLRGLSLVTSLRK